jgi:putative CocE/NonD family hydrolase
MKSEIRDGMKIDWDAPIEMDDGVVLRADVFRPVADGKYPVIMSYGPYAKGLSMQEGYKSQWLRIIKAAPDVLEGSSNKHQNWELFDPEKWVPDGYICLRVDSRGAGRSPGYLETWSPRESKGHRACVDWAGVQPWSNGKVGLHGISYYSMNQWQAAPLKPKHLAALCIWEGSSDYYRELCRHGGILSDFYSSWYPRQVTAVQHGIGERGARSVVTGEPVAGPLNLSDDELRKEPCRLRRRRAAPPADRRISQGAAAEVRRHRDAATLVRQLGRHGVCTRAAISRASSAPGRSRNGWRSTAIRTSPCSTRSTARTCSGSSSTVS